MNYEERVAVAAFDSSQKVRRLPFKAARQSEDVVVGRLETAAYALMVGTAETAETRLAAVIYANDAYKRL